MLNCLRFLKSIRAKENWKRKKMACLILAIMAILCSACLLLWLYPWLGRRPGEEISGVINLCLGDMNVYLSYLTQFQDGHVLLKNLFTSEAYRQAVFNPFFLFLAAAGSLLSANPAWAMLWLKILLIPLGVLAIYLVMRLYVKEWREQKIVLPLIIFGSGLGGFLGFLAKIFPFTGQVYGYGHGSLDLWAPEFNFFLSFIFSPHLILSFSFLLLGIYFWLSAEQKNSWWRALISGIFFLILSVSHPYYFPEIILLLGGYVFLTTLQDKKIYWSGVKKCLLVYLVLLIGVVHWLIVYKHDPAFQIHSFYNVLPMPVWWLTLISYGLFFPGLVLGTWLLFKRPQRDKVETFLLVWLISGFVLIFSPITVQRKLTEAMWLPVILANVIAYRHYFSSRLTDFLRQQPRSAKVQYLALFLFVVSSTNLIVLENNFDHARKHFSAFYISKSFIAANQWLKINLTPKDVVLSDYYLGNFIPAWSGRTVYVGNLPMSSWLQEEKLYKVKRFFNSNLNDEFKMKFLADNSITYILYDRQRDRLGFEPQTKEYLQLVQANQEIEIYRVSPALVNRNN